MGSVRECMGRVGGAVSKLSFATVFGGHRECVGVCGSVWECMGRGGGQFQIAMGKLSFATQYSSATLVSSPDPTLSRGETVW